MIVLYEVLEVVRAVHFDRPDPRLARLIERLMNEMRHAETLREEWEIKTDFECQRPNLKDRHEH